MHLLVAECSLVKARDDRAGVEDMRYAVLLERIEITCGSNRTCSPEIMVQRQDSTPDAALLHSQLR